MPKVQAEEELALESFREILNRSDGHAARHPARRGARRDARHRASPATPPGAAACHPGGAEPFVPGPRRASWPWSHHALQSAPNPGTNGFGQNGLISLGKTLGHELINGGEL